MAESRSDVALPPPSDILSPIITGALGEIINLDNIEIIIDTNGDVTATYTNTTPAPLHPPVPSALVPGLPPPGGAGTNQQQSQPTTACLDPESCAVLSADNIQLRETVKTQEVELSRMREKCLQLENHSSTGWLLQYYHMHFIYYLNF